MPQSAASHLGLHCLLRHKQSSGEEVQCGLEILTCDPSNQIYNLPSFIVSNSMERSIGLKRVNNVSSEQAKTKYNGIFHLA